MLCLLSKPSFTPFAGLATEDNHNWKGQWPQFATERHRTDAEWGGKVVEKQQKLYNTLQLQVVMVGHLGISYGG